MLPRCGSFLSVLPHALAQRSDPASEHPGFPSREGTQLYTTLSGMLPSPTCLHTRQTPEETPLPQIVTNYKSLAHSHSLFCLAAGALHKDVLSWKGGCRDTKLQFSDRLYLLDIFYPCPDLYRGG